MNLVVDGIIYQLQYHGGISRVFSEILPRMCEIDESLRITLLSSGDCKQPLPVHPHILHRIIPPIERFLRPGWLWGTSTITAREFVLRIWLQSERKSIWHSTYYTLPGFSWDGPVVVTVHDMIHERFAQYFRNANPFSRRKRKCIEQADKVIAVSNNTKTDILNLFGFSENKVSVVHNGVSGSLAPGSQGDMDRLKQQFGLRKPFILYVGNRWIYKNFQTLLKAYSSWKRRGDFDLICVGGESNWSRDETEVIMEANLEGSVRLFSLVPDKQLGAFYSGAQVFVYTSFYEGFGIPPLEAMACGAPVIVSNASSIPEVVGDAGLYFDPSSEEELIDALNKIMDDTHLRGELVRKGLERSKLFSWERTAAQTHDVYRDVS